MHRAVFGLAAVCILLVVPAYGQTPSPCDLNQDLAVNTVDVQMAVNMHTGLAPCTANIDGPGICTVTVVQKVVNTALGSACNATTPRTVRLNWTASTTAGVIGYNIYRRTGTSGQYVKLNASPVAAVSYTDSAVQSGQTYYYTTRAVTSQNLESADSNIAQAVIPAAS